MLIVSFIQNFHFFILLKEDSKSYLLVLKIPCIVILAYTMALKMLNLLYQIIRCVVVLLKTKLLILTWHNFLVRIYKLI